jgi:hypothetical protein
MTTDFRLPSPRRFGSLLPLVMLLALVSLSCVTSVHGAAVISTNSYTTVDCSTEPIPDRQQNRTAGVCTGLSVNQWQAWYCSAQGEYIYRLLFADSQCTAQTAFAMNRYATTCGAGNVNMQYVCHQPAEGPALPLGATFPPLGWAPHLSYVNATTYAVSPTCGVAAGVRVIERASRLGYCHLRGGASNTPGVSLATYCSTDATKYVTVLYTDAACTNVARAIVQSTGQYAATAATTHYARHRSDPGCHSDRHLTYCCMFLLLVSCLSV